jgi:RNA polymerase sigma-70 factor, ECF subfamily
VSADKRLQKSEQAGPEVAVVKRYQAALLAGGDPAESVAEELNALFGELWLPVYTLCHRFTGHPERARDLAQDTMLRALERIGQFRGESSFRSWLYSIARSVCSNALRTRREVLLEDGVIDAASPEATVVKQLDSRDRETLLRESLQAALDPLEQEAMHLRYVEELPVARITDLLELDPNSGARVVLQRCRRHLQRELRSRLAQIGRGSSWVRETL